MTSLIHQLDTLLNDDQHPSQSPAAMRGPRARRQNQPKRSPIPPAAILAQVDGDEPFTPSYAASHNEGLMLQQALTHFYRERIISDVLAPVKGGKEATVYCCRAHKATGLDLVAAKIYRPRAFRSLRNDAPYKEGREMLDQDGKPIRDARRFRALQKKTRFGMEVSIGSWIEHEYATLTTLYAAGADVPRPLGRAGTTILMEYLGEVRRPAPNLTGVSLSQRVAHALFDRLVQNVEIMLAHNRVHADLSAYNVLYWQQRGVIIDFPQAVMALTNAGAYSFLLRDLTRLCQHFSRYGVRADPEALAKDLWTRFLDAQL